VALRTLPVVAATVCVLAVASLSPRAMAQGVEQPIIELFDPLVTRNPTPEREFEVNVEYEKGAEGKEVEAEVELSWRFGDRIEASVEIPVVFLMPREGSDESGLGDITLGGKVLVFQSIDQPALVTVGLELGLPSGSESQGLGGSFSVTPYVTAGIGLGPIDLIGDIGYTWVVDGPDDGSETFAVSLAAAYKGWRHVTPMLEVSIVTQTRRANGSRGGEDEEGEEEPDVVGKPQVYLTPGVIVRSLSWMPAGTSFRGGVQIGLTHDREFDYRVLASFSWEF
jgi:Putative MetA-pathway of phenol degradation